MLLNKLSGFWKNEIFHYIKPTGLVKGIVASYRMLLDSLANIDSSPIDYPVGRGHLYATLELPIANISENVEVAGLGRQFTDSFPYMLVGAPSGIVRFSSAGSTTGLELYADFIEYCNIYYFRKSPLPYCTVNSLNHTVTFVISRYVTAAAELAGQDPQQIFPRSTSGFINRKLKQSAVDSRSTNGISTALNSMIGGITLSEGSEKLTNSWLEGGFRFAQLKNGEFIRLGKEGNATFADYGSILQVGESGRKLSKYLVVSDKDNNLYDVVLVDDVDQSVNLNEYPTLAAAISDVCSTSNLIRYDDLCDICRTRGIVTVDIGEPVSDSALQRYIDERTNKTSSFLLSSLHKVYVGEEVLKVLNSAECNSSYVYLSSQADTCNPPAYSPGISATAMLMRNVSDFSILKHKITKHGDCYFIVVTPGAGFGSPVTCHSRIHGISLVSEVDGKNYRSDSILHHIEISNIPMHAGGCVVIALMKNNKEDEDVI